MSKVWAQEFLNSNSQRAYPLSEDATGLDTTGDFELPTDFLLGVFFPISTGLDIDPSRIFLQRIAIYGTGLIVSLGYDDGVTTPEIIANAIIPRDTHSEYNTYALGGINDFADGIGHIVVGQLVNISRSAGVYLFDYAGGQLDPDCVRPMIRGLSRLTIRNGVELSEPITGDVELFAGTNIRLDFVSVPGGDPRIVINAISGVGLNTSCECLTDDTEALPIVTINNIPPDASGNFNFLGSDCLTIEIDGSDIKFEDICSKPCCGCEELVALTDRVSHLGDGATNLRNFLNTLATEVTQMGSVVLGSRLRDSGCVQCGG